MQRLGTWKVFTLLLMLPLVSLLGFVPPVAAEGEEQARSTFTLGAGIRALGVAFDSTGNLWFTSTDATATSSGGGRGEGLGRMTPGGEITEFPLEGKISRAGGDIVLAPDGALWFTLPATGSIGRRTPDGRIDVFPLPDRTAVPRGIEAAPDGSIWFAESGADRLGRIDTSGKVAEFALPAGSEPIGIAIGPEDTFWVTEKGVGRVARVWPDGTVNQFSLPGRHWRPASIAVDAAGNAWFGDRARPRVGRIGANGKVRAYRVPGSSGVGAVAVGPDGRAWYAWQTRIGWIGPNGEIGLPACAIPACDHAVTGMTVGPDGRLWFGTGTRIVTGGGGSGHFTLPGEPGLIGRFAPPAHVVIGSRPSPLKGRFASIDMWCDGGAAESPCGGELIAYAVFRFSLGNGLHERRWVELARRSYGFAPGTGGPVALEIAPRGRAAIRREGGLEVRVMATNVDGEGATRDVILRPFRWR